MRRNKYGKTYYQKHREACIDRAKAWYNAHKEHRRLYMLAYNGKQYFCINELDISKGLNTQSKILRPDAKDVQVELITKVGTYVVETATILSKMLALILRESHKPKEREGKTGYE